MSFPRDINAYAMENNRPGVTTPLEIASYENDGIFIRGNDYYKKCPYADILHVEASGSYSTFYLKNASRLVAARRLATIERKLPDNHFVRVHRGFIVNRHHVDAYTGTTVRVGEKWFPVGDCYRKKVLDCLNILDALN